MNVSEKAVTTAYFFDALPHFLAYFATAVVLAVVFLAIYVRVTPLEEFKLIGEGKTAPALSLVGSFLGFAIPLAVVIGHSVNLLDVILWGATVLVIQIAVFMVISKLLFKTITQRLIDNCNASGLFIGGISAGVGILQAACMVP